jgi:LPXTG-site transpeptidase (sortase) family protein
MSKSTPLKVTIPKIKAESSLIPLGLEPDGTLQVPPVSTPMQAGWYREGPTPGETGPAVIAGHVDGMKRPGIFFRLRELSVGDVVLVERSDRTTAKFTVSDKQQVSKSRFPTERVYGDTAEPELRLITCGGAFDRSGHNYLDNIIVYAKLTR